MLRFDMSNNGCPKNMQRADWLKFFARESMILFSS